jgi:predicted kinase
MRKLIILRGAMGAGKSTFIKEQNLERFTLCADNIRLLLNAPELTMSYSDRIPQFNNIKVWEILYTLLEERMRKGELTIIDAVHAKKEDVMIYKKLSEKYRYRLYIVDFTTIPKEEVYKRNQNRESYKIVPSDAIDRVYKTFSKEKMPNSFQTIEPTQFNSIINNNPKDFNQFKNIHIIGDIHGCYTALKSYFDQNPICEEDAYIFLGDYFDRGIENTQVFHFLIQLMQKKNMFFLVGNHEDKLYKYACDDAFTLDYDIKNTIQEFKQNQITKSDIRGFVKKLSQIIYLSFHDKTYIINHGGIPYFPKLPLDYYSTNSFIYGIEPYEMNIDKLYHTYMENEEKKVYQIHGHRNYSKINIDTYSYSYNLEGDVEHGGSLRILTLKEDGTYSYTTIKNEIYNKNLIEETSVYNLIQSLRKNRYVYEKNLENDISSFNFTKEAFYHHIWNATTTHARGLFIDTNKNKIVARSYDKFFNYEERKETSKKELEKNLCFPIQVYIKYNGFLGILSQIDGEFFFATKSTNTGDYATYFKTIFYGLFTKKQIEAIRKILIEEKATMVFEVIDPVHDPHIIKYEKENLILLDIIYNCTEFSKMDYSHLETFAKINKIEVKKLYCVINTISEFYPLIERIKDKNYKIDDSFIEGFVLEDGNQFMLKVKSVYYEEWKYLRNRMEFAILNNNFTSKGKVPLEDTFMAYLEKKYKNKQIEGKNQSIIQEREQFLKEIKKNLSCQ